MYYLTQAQVNNFCDQLHLEEKAPSTIAKYVHDVNAFLSYLSVNTLTKEDGIAYKQHLLDKGYAVRSVNAVIASLNRFFCFIGAQDCTLKSLRIQRKVYCPEEKELTKTEYVCLVETAKAQNNERLALIIQTICATGIRVSELEYVTVDAVRKGEAVVSCKGKIRTVFIVSKLRANLLQYCDFHQIQQGAVFVTRTGMPVSRMNIWREMKEICIKADVDPQKVYPHNLRHLFARTFYDVEKDIVKLADILGHASVNTTRIYVMTTGEEHRRRMENMRLVI